jgi:hypothetical protein
MVPQREKFLVPIVAGLSASEIEVLLPRFLQLDGQMEEVVRYVVVIL